MSKVNGRKFVTKYKSAQSKLPLKTCLNATKDSNSARMPVSSNTSLTAASPINSPENETKKKKCYAIIK